MSQTHDEERCSDPLELHPAAQQAFADRQAKLIKRKEWPNGTKWYSDEDFCRAYNTAVAMHTEVNRLRGVCNMLADQLSHYTGGTVPGEIRKAEAAEKEGEK